MRKIFMMIAVLSVVTMVASAQIYTPAQPDNQVFQSQQVMQGGAYRGTVYEPFSTETPSQRSAASPAYSPGPRREQAIGDGRTPGEASTGSNQSPIGDAVLPLLLCAGTFCGVVYYRRRKALKS